MKNIITYIKSLFSKKSQEVKIEQSELKERAKKFALEQIAPYFKDPSICGYENGGCVNLTKDGRMCVAGKNYLPEIRNEFKVAPVVDISAAFNDDQSKIFRPEAVDILDLNQWEDLQCLHDSIAHCGVAKGGIINPIERLNLFTYEELVEYCK